MLLEELKEQMKYFHESLIKMECLKQQILHEIDERTKELSLIIKKASKLNDKYINKFFLTAIYANWETFIKNSIKYYITYLDNNNILKNHYFISLIIKHAKLFEKNLTDQNQIQKVLEEINQIKLNPQLNADNINFKIMNFDNTNKLLQQFKLPEFNKENRVILNTLVKHRNWVAHGKQEICLNDITLNKIREYVNLIEEMMNEFLLNINDENII